MLLANCSEWETLYHIFDQIDNLLKTMNTSLRRKLLSDLRRKGGRPSGLSLQAILALGIFRFATGVKDVKHYHRKLLSSYPKELGRIPNYGNFNTLMNQATPYVIFLLQWICYCNKSANDGLYFLDSTSLKVCENKRIFDHKVCE